MRSQAGFSLLELTVAMGIMLVVVGTGMSAILQVVNSQQTIWNRTEMHSGVRSATELLQQEVGQAGRLPPLNAVTLSANAAVGAGPATVASTAGMFNGEQVIVDSGINQETVTISNVTGTQFTATFINAHAAGVPVMAAGGFWGGVVPVGQANGSTGTVLKLFGDINSDGNMLYIEYTCDTAGGNLYRNTMAWNAGAKPAVTPSMVLLRNIVANPGNAACFTYQTQVVNGTSFVIDVAITLTVQTQQLDPLTHQFQKETKALLNVSPRNIFDVWELASAGLINRVQPIPPTVLALLP